MSTTEFSREEIEREARAICAEQGIDPDEEVSSYRLFWPSGMPPLGVTRRWDAFTKEAEARLRRKKGEKVRPVFVLGPLQSQPWACLTRDLATDTLTYRFFPDAMNADAQKGDEMAMLCRHIYERGVQAGREARESP